MTGLFVFFTPVNIDEKPADRVAIERLNANGYDRVPRPCKKAFITVIFGLSPFAI